MGALTRRRLRFSVQRIPLIFLWKFLFSHFPDLHVFIFYLMTSHSHNSPFLFQRCSFSNPQGCTATFKSLWQDGIQRSFYFGTKQSLFKDPPLMYRFHKILHHSKLVFQCCCHEVWVFVCWLVGSVLGHASFMLLTSSLPFLVIDSHWRGKRLGSKVGLSSVWF